ncbi:hypothetical protein [Tychonema sp. LEGE 07203]|uniref:hypothetical protein n=1 Tax=Tychonema sp. LEGE 07203 TaxID=1828671 RepID=UPI00188051A6|nr:hypothetical protein [Tychonema sp. LEGE 07203]MBE9092432.1 hypothetical protein [Tychonema sp. LEGE 07203]
MEEYKAKKYLPIKIDFELDFCTNEAKIYTTDELYVLSPGSSECDSDSSSKKETFLVIEVWTQLDDDSDFFENLISYTRPSVLIILSIISYLLDHPLTVYEMSVCDTGIASMDRRPNEIKVSKFVHAQVDKSRDLLIILEAVYEKKESVNEFVVSLLNRWHKARYLETQDDTSLFYEEIFLVYFHIIELCSNHCKPQGKIPLRSKICDFLDRVELLDIKTEYFVKQLVNIRNTIAHGRHVNHKTLNWPLPSFFSINGDVENCIFEIRAFTARLIGAYLSLEAWIDKWADVHSWLHMPPEHIKNFISDNSFEFITPTDFLKGTINGVRPSSLVKEFLSNKIEFQELEIGLRSFMLDVEVDEESALEIFEAAIVLADSLDKRLSDRCRSIVVDLHENDLRFYFNMQNLLKEIEQQGVRLIWLREWVESGGHIS